MPVKRKLGKKKNGKKKHPGAPRLSVCVIARDEEGIIGTCLRSVAGWSDEVHVVDTGSVDRTPDIASELGAKVHHHPWRDDFSEARNYAISRATGDWILFLDADEEIDEANKARVRELIGRNEPVAAYRIAIHSIMPEGRFGGCFVNSYPRLFRRDGFRYEGRIHEQIEPSIERKGGVVRESDVSIYHHGYNLSPDREIEKIERNIELLRREIEESPSNTSATFHLAESFLLKGDLGGAERYYREAIGRKDLPDSLKAVAWQNLGQVMLKRGNYEESMEDCRRALKIDPTLLTPYLVIARAGHSLGDTDRVVSALKEYIRRSERSGGASIHFAFKPNLGYAWTLLGHTCLKRGDRESARDAYERAIAEGANYPELHEGLAKCCLALREFSGASVHLLERLRMGNAAATHYCDLAASYYGQGLRREARAAAEKAAGMDGGNGPAHAILAQIWLEEGDLEAAFDHFRTSLELGQWSAYLSGLEIALRGRIDTLSVSLVEHMLSSPLGVEEYRQALSLLVNVKKWDLAMQLYGGAVDRIGEQVELLSCLGRILLGIGDNATATDVFERIREVNSQDAEIRYCLTIGYLKQKRLKEAMEEIRGLLDLNPSDQQAKGLLERLKGLIDSNDTVDKT